MLIVYNNYPLIFPNIGLRTLQDAKSELLFNQYHMIVIFLFLKELVIKNEYRLCENWYKKDIRLFCLFLIQIQDSLL